MEGYRAAMSARRRIGAVIDALFSCGASYCKLDRFYWFNLARGLRA